MGSIFHPVYNVIYFAADFIEIITLCFCLTEKDIKSRDVTADGTDTKFISLNKCCPGATERIENLLPFFKIFPKENLNQLGYKFPKIWMKSVNMLCSYTFR